MNVHFYEKLWMWASGVLIVAFVATIVVGLAGNALQPPSHVETIDPTKVWNDPRFQHRGVTVTSDRATVVMIAMMFAFQPAEVHVTAGKPVTFRLTSADVVHGFEIVGTNGNTMVVPGYVSQFTTVFHTPGEYLIVCNEYCGLSHHVMFAKLIVEGAQP
ncbi:MAG TPA: cupredoxin domain-containing protein [Gemmatimonadales bacterium]|nr:cupredoxin domain-containing protein [Gemmatimonadales bacterium]